MNTRSTVKIECPSCGQHYSLELGSEPISITCQKCGAEFVAEAINDAEETPDAAAVVIPRVPSVPSHSPSQSTMRYYYISADNQAAGPVDQGQLQELFRQGQITGETGIALEGTTAWIPFRQVQFQQQQTVSPARTNIPGSYAGSPVGEPPQVQSPKNVILASWLMIGVTCLVALIPGIGFLTWLIAAPILLVTFILGIMALNKGATSQGIMILLASLIVAPLFLFIAPFVTTAMAVGGGAAVAASAVEDELARDIQKQNIAPQPAETEVSLGVPTPTHPRTQTAVPSPRAPSPQASGKKATPQVGEAVNLKGLQLEITGVNQRRIVGGEFAESKASKGGVYLVVDWTYKNASKKPMGAFSKPDLTLLSPDGTEYEEDMGATVSRATEVDLDEKILSNLNPGITVQSAAVFEVAENLIAEEGWRIQIEFDGSKTFFAVDTASKKAQSANDSDADASPRANSNSTRGESSETLKARKERELAAAVKAAEEIKKIDSRLAELQGFYVEENGIINRLTNFKRTPIQKGTQAYYEFLEADKRLRLIATEGQELKQKKASLGSGGAIPASGGDIPAARDDSSDPFR